MNTNPPNDHIRTNEDPMPVVINIQPEFKTGMVRTATGKKFPVKLQDWLIEGIKLMDYVELKKSAVTGEWIVTNYFVNGDFYNDDYYQEVLI